jgi:hypothetical protein
MSAVLKPEAPAKDRGYTLHTPIGVCSSPRAASSHTILRWRVRLQRTRNDGDSKCFLILFILSELNSMSSDMKDVVNNFDRLEADPTKKEILSFRLTRSNRQLRRILADHEHLRR